MTAMRVFVGYDPRQDVGYCVCRDSILAHASASVDIRPLVLADLQNAGLYTRPTERRDGGQLWDVISDAPMATEFALSRFLVPYLCEYKGVALFVDADFMFRADIGRLFAWHDPTCAVQVVQHNYEQAEGLKMDGRRQTTYARKNWSSLMLFNCEHEATRRLTLEAVNNWRGLALHQFAWCSAYEIGALPFNWNWLDIPPAAVHFTEGMPYLGGRFAEHPYAHEWFRYARTDQA